MTNDHSETRKVPLRGRARPLSQTFEPGQCGELYAKISAYATPDGEGRPVVRDVQTILRQQLGLPPEDVESAVSALVAGMWIIPCGDNMWRLRERQRAAPDRRRREAHQPFQYVPRRPGGSKSEVSQPPPIPAEDGPALADAGAAALLRELDLLRGEIERRRGWSVPAKSGASAAPARRKDVLAQGPERHAPGVPIVPSDVDAIMYRRARWLSEEWIRAAFIELSGRDHRLADVRRWLGAYGAGIRVVARQDESGGERTFWHERDLHDTIVHRATALVFGASRREDRR